MNTHNMTLLNKNACVSLDRLSICFNDPNIENVNGTVGLLLSEAYTKTIPGFKATKNARYKVSAAIPVPFMSSSLHTHPIYFEAGPRLPGLASYRVDFYPSKLSPEGLSDLMVLLDGMIDQTPFEFFSMGRVTRIDAAVDVLGVTLEEVIVRSSRKKKHGVYCSHYGNPETVYLGTPRSARLVAYNKIDKVSGHSATRIECRLKPKCLGINVASIANPFAKVQLISADVINGLLHGIPGQFIADSIRIRGVKHALKVLPPEQRKIVLHALASSTSLLPDANELWAGWPLALIKVGLGQELGALPQITAPYPLDLSDLCNHHNNSAKHPGMPS